MKRQDALYVAMCVGAIAFCIAFVLPSFVTMPVAWYLPLDRGWELTAKPTVLGLDFYGRCAQGLAGWAIAVIASLAVTKRMKSDLSSRMAGLLAAWTIGMIVLCIMYFVWTLVFRVPTPAPLPTWYIPR
ncbi:MAG TPA: hypothetical protein VGM90_16155 [Kofleriaceae bacterium]|jgi:hypothetical protein